jgi:micrococcal nuclease
MINTSENNQSSNPKHQRITIDQFPISKGRVFANWLLVIGAHLALGIWLLVIFASGVVAKENEGNLYRVIWVIDGDTIRIEGGQLVRYIGIDTPEIRERRNNGRWKYDPESYAEEAKKLNESLVKGRAVKLEFDVQERDRFGRLLAYVYVGDIFVNQEIIRQGYAQLLTIPPNVRYVEQFKKVLFQARKEKRGIWKLR